jgi:hypothetical protein
MNRKQRRRQEKEKPRQSKNKYTLNSHLKIREYRSLFLSKLTQLKTNYISQTNFPKEPEKRSCIWDFRDLDETDEWLGLFLIEVNNLKFGLRFIYKTENFKVFSFTIAAQHIDGAKESSVFAFAPDSMTYTLLSYAISRKEVNDMINECVFLENPLPESPLFHVGNVILDALKNCGLYPTPQPNYEELTELYLSKGVAALNSSILVWLNENYLSDNNPLIQGSYLNQISRTVFEMAAKKSQVLASHNPKTAIFTLKFPFEPIDYSLHKPVQTHLSLANEGMALINTGFFNKAITELINSEKDAIKTLRGNGIVLYMGINDKLEIFDTACALVTWKPFEIVKFVGEQRNSLNSVIKKTFQPIVDKIQDFRVNQKQSDKFPCLSLLCMIENKVTGDICEFRRHFTAQSGGQLIIPGFSDGIDSTVIVSPPMEILGSPKNIPAIRGFNCH